LVNLVSAYIEHFTYLGLFVVLALCGLGLPLPEDVALLTGGYLAHRGLIRYPITIAVSLVGVVAGDNSLYFLGRRVGSGLLAYFGVRRPGSREQVARLRAFMDRHGNLAIFYARFFAGFRALVYLSAGSLGVTPARFLFYDLLGALISVPLVISIGYVFGGEIERAVRYVGGVEKVVWVVVLLCLAIYATRLLAWAGESKT
jgi:membrane protein DedA with SNARE-associated domain